MTKDAEKTLIEEITEIADRISETQEAMRGPKERVETKIGEPLTMQDHMDLQSFKRMRESFPQLHAEVEGLRKTLEDKTGVVPRCGQCGKDTHYIDMMRTVDGLLICHHCAYWD